MKERVLKALVAILLIITLTMANFIMVSFNAITYAVSVISNQTPTNNKNVTFDVYFKGENGEEYSAYEEPINNEQIELFIKIGVKSGYFNGMVTLNNSNFKLKEEILNEKINRINGNTIVLNQINSGDVAEINVGIEAIKNDKINSELLSMPSRIEINGIYKDSSERDISIQAEREVMLTFDSPYEATQGAYLNSEVLTNKVFEINGENKRVVQVLIKSGLLDNGYPIKSTNIEISALDNIESVEVISRGTYATNGKDGNAFGMNSWTYFPEQKKIVISVENNEENGLISWNKEKKDEFVVTYIVNPNSDITGQNISSTSSIILYDTKSSLKSAGAISQISEEKDGIISTELELKEASIYKGNLYSKENRDYNVQTNIYATNNKVNKNIDIELGQSAYETDTQTLVANSEYRLSTINKEEMIRVLGEDGYMKIGNTTVTKESAVNDEGNIVVAYLDGTKTVKIETSEVKNNGTIKILSTKTIKAEEYTNDEITNIKALKEIATGSEARIELKNTSTVAELNINKEYLYTMAENTELEMNVVLKTNDEAYDLYKNPELRIVLPRQIENVTINSVNMMYEDQMVIENAYYDSDNKTIIVLLSGEQTKHKYNIMEETTIYINANVTVNKKETNSKEVVKLIYTNEKMNTQNEIDRTLDIVAPKGMVVVNNINDYGMMTIGKEENKSARLEIGTTERQAQVNIEVINNNGTEAKNVKILGNYPTKQNENTINATVTPVSVQGLDATVYYSENENASEDINESANAWNTTFNNPLSVKKYLIVIDNMEVAQNMVATYTMNIPANLVYNESMAETYKVIYTDSATNSQYSVDSTKLELSTGKGPEIKAELKAKVGQEEVKTNSKVKTGEIIKYVATVSNTGTEDAVNVEITGNIPEGTRYIEKVKSEVGNIDKYNEMEEVKDYKITIDRIAVGETKNVEYEVKVYANSTENQKLSNKININYGELTTSTDEIILDAESSSIFVEVNMGYYDEEIPIISGENVQYYAYVTNASNTELKNIEMNWILPEGTTIVGQEIVKNYIDLDIVEEREQGNNNTDVTIVDNNKTVRLDQIDANTTTLVCATLTINENIDSLKDFNISATASVNGESIKSNSVENQAHGIKDVSINLTANKENGYLDAGEEVDYKIVTTNNNDVDVKGIAITDKLPKELTVVEVSVNGKAYNIQELAENSTGMVRALVDEENREATVTLNNNNVAINQDLAKGQSSEIIIKALVDYDEDREVAVPITNKADLTVTTDITKSSQEINHILLANAQEIDEIENSEENGESPSGQEANNANTGENTVTENNNNSDNSQIETNTNESETRTSNVGIISGMAWLDENKNGQRDADEEVLSGINVKLINALDGNIAKDIAGKDLSAQTSEKGLYIFNQVPKGQYLVVFEYDTNKYTVTSYHKDGIAEEHNSDAVIKQITINAKSGTYGVTDMVTIDNNNVSNIDLGLIYATTFDMQLDKYVSKIVVQNSKGTNTYDYNDATLAKVEINAKQLEGTNVIIEYQIKVTNAGEIAGYVRNIVDYLPSDLKFNSELNKDWYQSGNNIYNTSLANTKLEAGESKIFTLTLTKVMTEENTGRFNNGAELYEVYNELGLQDTDSTPGNKVQTEDDYGSADVIISVATGAMLTYVWLTVSIIVLIGIAAYFVYRKVEKDNEIKVNI